MHVTATEFLGGDLLARGRLHQGRSTQEDRALLLDDHHLVAHRRHVGAPGGARTHDRGDLRNAARAHLGLVVEDAPEVVAVGKDLGLHGQERAAAVDEVDAGQVVLHRDLLRPQMLLHRQRMIGTAFDRGVVGHDHHLAPVDVAHPGHQAGRRQRRLVDLVGGQRRELEEGASRIEQGVDAFAHEHLAPALVQFTGLLAAAPARFLHALLPELDPFEIGLEVALEIGRLRGDRAAEPAHDGCLRDGLRAEGNPATTRVEKGWHAKPRV